MTTTPDATPAATHHLVRALSDPESQDPARVGTKAATLARLLSAGFAVPGGEVLCVEAYGDTVGRLPVRTEEAVASCRLPESVERAILQVAHRMQGVALAVRSSSPSEDLQDLSFAGQYDTVLGVRGAEQLTDAVRLCWASASSERADAYRRERGLPPAPMAVLVQRQVDAEAAGVAFTADPVTGDRTVTVVNAVTGLGDRLVSGEATPEEWRVTEGRAARSGGPGVLSEAQAEAVAALAREVEASFGVPQDIEWAIDGDGLWLLQARPVTGLPARAIVPVPPDLEVPDGYWERDASHFPAPLSPLQRSLMYPYAAPVLTQVFAELGILAERIAVRDIRGWHYVCVVPMGSGGDRNPPTWLAWLAVRLHPAMRRRLKAAARAQREDLSGQYLQRWYDEWMPDMDRRISALKAVDVAALRDEELLAHLEDAVALKLNGLTTHVRTLVWTLIEPYRLAKVCQELLGMGPAEVLDLLAGLSRRSTEPARRLSALADLARSRPDVLDAIRSGRAQSADDLRAVHPELADGVDAYIRDYGHQGLSRDMIDPTMGERPALLLQLVAEQVQTGFDPVTTDDESRQGRERALAAVRERLDALAAEDRLQFEDALERARRAYPTFEDNIFYNLFGPEGLVRRAALEMGARMADRGLLDEAADAIFLEHPELRRAFADSEDMRDLARRRIGERMWAEAHPGPDHYGTPPGPTPSLGFLPEPARFTMEALIWNLELTFDIGRPEENTVERLRGAAASAGRYTGPVRVITSEAEFGKIRAGDVLVCPTTSPTWSLLFPSLGALVTDSGGILNHPAIISREYRIPAVVGTGNATRLLHDGQMVTVDGSAGTVTAH